MPSAIDPDVRRLPIYLLIDCSSSMMGAPIEAVKEGIKMLMTDLGRDPFSQGVVWLSIITFNNKAEQVVPLTEIGQVKEPAIQASGSTALALALRTLKQCIGREFRRRTEDQRGDYRPVVYLLTDGRPTDSGWEDAAQDLRQFKLGGFIACAAGPDADDQMLAKVADTVIRLQDASPDTLRAFIRWVSSSIGARSRSVGLSGFEEPPLQDGAKIAAERSAAADVGPGASLTPKGVRPIH